MKVFGQLIRAQLENLTSNPSPGVAGRVLWNTTSKQAFLDDGLVLRSLGGAGGGGGGANWQPLPGSGPLEDVENSEKVWLFQAGLTQKLNLFVKVPSSFSGGLPIKMLLGSYSPSAVNTQLLTSVATLIRKNTDSVSDITNQRTSTNTALTNTVASQYRQHTLDLTDAAGLVNGVAVAGGDLLRVELTRGTDTDTNDVRFIPSSTEVTFS